ncbi:MAG: acetylneuraminic acid synthetase [Acidiferrobacteraceae bacterium]|nr:acetylneuraminic acid synthetase [Acidiferrobacteraceae bacterium]|tara:strand:+ start:176 stop:1237 length:1062 start_codon:yes stop_codon:yes gene_type:complete
MKLKSLFEKPSDFINRSSYRPYVIAEAGVNHEGNMDIAHRLIAEAAEAGAHAIKFQTYRAETLASKESPAYWDMTKEPTRSQFELFRKYDKFWKNEFEQLKKRCDYESIEFLSTPFDIEAVVFLDDLMEVFKISSSDITNKPFIEFISSRGKPIVLSTGAADLSEIHDGVNWIEAYDVPVALLHCILQYPTDDPSANLGMIRGLRKEFPDKLIGYSDHTMPKKMKSLELATLLGAVILEKHFTHDKTLPGNDHYHAMDRHDLELFFRNLNHVELILGTDEIASLPSEEISRKHARRSLVAARRINSGENILREDLTWKRPGSGISPKYIDSLIGKKAISEIEKDVVLKWEMVE